MREYIVCRSDNIFTLCICCILYNAELSSMSQASNRLVSFEYSCALLLSSINTARFLLYAFLATLQMTLYRMTP